MRGLTSCAIAIAILVFLLFEPLHAQPQANGTLGALDEADQNFLSSAAEIVRQKSSYASRPSKSRARLQLGPAMASGSPVRMSQ